MKIFSPNRILQIIFIAAGAVAVVVIGITAMNYSRTIQIGVVTSSNGLYADESEQLIAGANAMASELNRNCLLFLPWDSHCGINGHRIKILPVRSEDDLSKVTAVVGDFAGDDPWTDRQLYEEKSIPAILTTPGGQATGQSSYSFRIVPDNGQIGTFLANYGRIDLGAQTASVIYNSSDKNSLALKDGFCYPFVGIEVSDKKGGVAKRGKIIKEWDLSDPGISIDTIIINILSPGKSENPGLIFVAVNADEAAPILVEMHRKGVTNTIVANTDLAGESFVGQFSGLPEEGAQPGYFTEGLYASSPLIFDGGNHSAQSFRNEFLARNSSEPSWAAAVAYDAVHVIAASVSPALTVGSSKKNPSLTGKVEQDRETIREALNDTNGIMYSDNGLTGQTSFEYQSSVKPIVMGVFNQGKFISAPVQYYPVEDIRFVPDFHAKVAAGRIITRGGSYLYKTNIVYSGVNFNEISNIDENESSYFVDFYLWFRYQNNDPENDPIDSEQIQFINALTAPEIVLIENRPPAQKSGSTQASFNNLTYKLFRVKGEFTSSFDFKDYPFDRQDIEIRFRHNEFQREDLIFVVDRLGPSEVWGQSNSAAVFNTAGDWNVGTTEFYQDSFVIKSSLGNPELFQIRNPDMEYSTFNGLIPIWRNLPSFMLRNLLPVLFSIMLAYLSFFLPRNEFGTREGILSGTILSIAFFHLGVSSFLGSIGYTTALDNIFYLFYALILAGLGTTLLEWLQHIDNEKLEKKIEELREETDDPDQKQKIKDLRAKIEVNNRQGNALFLWGRRAYPLILLVIALGYGIYYRETIFRREPVYAAAEAEPAPVSAAANEEVVLRLGSWRADDQASITRILQEFKNDTGIQVDFEPIVNSDYEKILRLQLENGIAPDLIYLSPAGGRVLDPEALYKHGYVADLSELIPEIAQSFSESDLQTWRTAEDKIYGLPIYAVSHGIYYNTEVFESLGLTPPNTWDELLEVAQAIQDAGYTPFANGIYETTDPQRIGDYYFLSLAPTYIGGGEGRKKFETGELCFNDPSVVAIFEAIRDLAPYMPEDLATLTYTESVQRFYDGRAVMYFSGSFDIDKFEKSAKVKWSVFPIPAPAGYTSYVTFHIDTAIGLNKNSPHQKEAILFMKWLTQKRFGELVGENLPGFYPLNKDVRNNVDVIKNRNSKTFLDFNNQSSVQTDVRWNLPIAKVPDGRSLMQQGVFGVIKGTLTPQQAADLLQSGLAQWYLPAQRCQPVLTPTPTVTSTPEPTLTPTPTLETGPTSTPTPGENDL